MIRRQPQGMVTGGAVGTRRCSIVHGQRTRVLDKMELLNRIGNDTHKHTVFIFHVSNEPEAYFVAHLAPKTREKHRLTYRPFNFLKRPPSAS